MSVDTGHVQRFEASARALDRLIAEQAASSRVQVGLESLTKMLIERMRPTGGRAVTLGPGDVSALEEAARERGPEVEAAFKQLLSSALTGTVETGAGKVPLLLLDEGARAQLAGFAGASAITDQTVRGGLEATADGDGPRIKTRTTGTLLQLERYRMEGLDGKARGGRSPTKPSDVGLVGAGIREVAQQAGSSPSVAMETLEALGPRIDQAVSSVGVALWKDEHVRGSLLKLVTDPARAKELLPVLCKDTGSALSTVLGCKLVNEEVVRGGLHLLPSIGKRLGIEGIEQATANIGKVLVKEGAEEAVKVGAKQGVKKGVMGLLSTIPLANVVPMLFTGAEMLAELTKAPPDKRTLTKGVTTFALQVGALAFPPLGLAATAVDLTGSVAIGVAKGQEAGLDRNERRSVAGEAIARHGERDHDMTQAIGTNADLCSQALTAMERSFRELGSRDAAERAKTLAGRAAELMKNPEDEEGARQLHRDIGSFSFETLLPELITRVKRLGHEDSESGSHWKLMADGLSQINASAIGVRSDPERNEPKLKMLIQGILKTGIAGSALVGEPVHPAQVVEREA